MRASREWIELGFAQQSASRVTIHETSVAGAVVAVELDGPDGRPWASSATVSSRYGEGSGSASSKSFGAEFDANAVRDFRLHR